MSTLQDLDKAVEKFKEDYQAFLEATTNLSKTHRAVRCLILSTRVVSCLRGLSVILYDTLDKEKEVDENK